ncbi:MAG: hypothetical protein QM698_13835 [Micropepsaceae bacterium]
MCFSATASLIAGGVLSAAGIGALAVTRERRAAPFAAVPLLFGVQQVAEGVLWLAASGGDVALQACASATFLSFAQVIWPLYAPLAVLALEPRGWRRHAMWACFACGVIVAAAMLHGLVSGHVPGVPEGGHIRYTLPYYNSFRDAGLLEVLLALYVAATCVSLMLSRERLVQAFGAVVFVALCGTAFAYEAWLFSVWCFFAACLSAIVVLWAIRRARTS